MQELTQLNEHKKPVHIIVRMGSVTHSLEVNTYGDLGVLFSAIQQATGLTRDQVIPESFSVTVKRIVNGNYYGGVK